MFIYCRSVLPNPLLIKIKALPRSRSFWSLQLPENLDSNDKIEALTRSHSFWSLKLPKDLLDSSKRRIDPAIRSRLQER